MLASAMTTPQARKGGASMEAQDDRSLLQAVAQKRDRAAFEELYLRYNSAALNLARHLTGRHDAAEEAVQAAMLNLWLHADSYRPDGKARNWILRIVARASLDCMRKRRREERIKMRVDQGTRTVAEPPPGLDCGELLTGIRTCLEDLPQRQRTMLALAYGAEMSHREIAQSLAMPERTVTHQIQEALQFLRGKLTRAGFAAAVPALGAERLCEALCSGYPVSLDLKQAVLARLGEAGEATLQLVSRRAVAAKSSAGIYWAMATLTAGVVASALFVASPGTPPSTPQPPAQQTAPQPAPLPAAPVPVPQKRHGIWSFEKGPSGDLKVRSGEWHWVPAQNGLPAGMAVPGVSALVTLPIEFPEGTSVEVIILGYLSQPSANVGIMSAHWMSNRGQKSSIWAKHSYSRYVSHMSGRCFLTPEWVVNTLWSPPTQLQQATIMEFKGRLDRLPFVGLALSNCLVEEIEIREIALEAIPERFRDRKKLIAELKLEPLIQTGPFTWAEKTQKTR